MQHPVIRTRITGSFTESEKVRLKSFYLTFLIKLKQKPQWVLSYCISDCGINVFCFLFCQKEMFVFNQTWGIKEVLTVRTQ